MNQRNRRTNQSKYFGDFYSGSSASGNGNQAWCNTGSQSLRGPQVVDQSLCQDAFDAFADSSFIYLGVLTTNDARFFQSNGNNGDPDISEFPTGCYVRQGNGNSAIKSFAFIQTSQTQKPSGNKSIQPVCLQNVCPTGFTGKKAINSCESFVYCTNGEITSGPQSCGAGTLFDNFYGICNHDYHVNCDGEPTPQCTCTNGELVPVENCKGYQYCGNYNQLFGTTQYCGPGTIFKKVGTGGHCDWPANVNCDSQICSGNPTQPDTTNAVSIYT